MYKRILFISLFSALLFGFKADVGAPPAVEELAIGGITPSYGLLKKVVDSVSIPVFVLIRPRSGNFTYSDVEFEIMKENIKLNTRQDLFRIF